MFKVDLNSTDDSKDEITFLTVQKGQLNKKGVYIGISWQNEVSLASNDLGFYTDISKDIEKLQQLLIEINGCHCKKCNPKT